MVTLIKILHKGETRIRVDLPNKAECTQKIRQVPGRTFSGSLKCWHVPYTQEAYQLLGILFPNLTIVKPASTQSPTDTKHGDAEKPGSLKAYSNETAAGKSPALFPSHPQTQDKVTIFYQQGYVHIQTRGKSLKIFLPKNDADTTFITSFTYYRWIKAERCWQVPNYADNLKKLITYFGNRLHSVEQIAVAAANPNPIIPPAKENVWFCYQKMNGRLAIQSFYDAVLVAFIKKQPYPVFDAENRIWTVAWYEKLRAALENLAQQHGKKVEWVLEYKENKGLPRPPYRKMANYKPCPAEYAAKLKQLNYTESTIENYVPLFEEFINYYADTEIADITPEMIEKYMQYLVIERKFGSSSHKIAISAIKFYYEAVLHKPKHAYYFEQPQTEKKLPVVLNKQEVEKMLDLTTNLKHKTLLTLAYSSGLRVGEIIGLEVPDIDTLRSTIHIRQGKGLKDRYSFLAHKCRHLLIRYLEVYKPRVYLFEGEDGDQYSSRSAQLVFHQAIKRAGIKKDVKFHTLRHSFATHALENGTNLRIIQEILGHNSSKTTEIYTHVTQKTLEDFRNPLDFP